MKRMRLNAYAVKHKMSLFQVVKAVKSGELPSETVEENGKEVTYVLVDDHTAEESAKQNTSDTTTTNRDTTLRQEIEALKSEIKLLKREVSQLKKRVGSGVVL